jgi:hypothetical protein
MLDLDNGGNGEYIRFKPSVNAWYVDGEEFDLKGMSLDPTSLKTGWGLIQEGEAPQWVWDDTVGVKGPRPDGEYKRGFSVMVHLKDIGPREWSSNGAGVNKGLSNIWKAIHDGLKDNRGKIAGLKYSGSTADTSGKGATRIPNFELVQWNDLPNQPVDTPPAPDKAQEDDEPLF